MISASHGNARRGTLRWEVVYIESEVRDRKSSCVPILPAMGELSPEGCEQGFLIGQTSRKQKRQNKYNIVYNNIATSTQQVEWEAVAS